MTKVNDRFATYREFKECVNDIREDIKGLRSEVKEGFHTFKMNDLAHAEAERKCIKDEMKAGFEVSAKEISDLKKYIAKILLLLATAGVGAAKLIGVLGG